MVQRKTHLLDKPFPVLAHSFSSKGFVDLPNLFASLVTYVPDAYLLSLYDYRYLFPEGNPFTQDDNRIRIWDSGGYETSTDDDLSSYFSAIAGKDDWTEERYILTANSISWKHQDILVNYDSHPGRLTDSAAAQLDKACLLYERIPGNYLRDVLIHLDNAIDIQSLAKDISSFSGCFDIIGFTEKEVAPTWSQGVNFISAIRNELNYALGEYVPMHLFGCFDPKSIIYFFLAGADIFDGLSWLRYFMHKRSTMYMREYESYIGQSEHESLGDYRPEIFAHNVSELRRLGLDLSFSLLTDDYSAFAEEVEFVTRATARAGGLK